MTKAQHLYTSVLAETASSATMTAKQASVRMHTPDWFQPDWLQLHTPAWMTPGLKGITPSESRKGARAAKATKVGLKAALGLGVVAGGGYLYHKYKKTPAKVTEKVAVKLEETAAAADDTKTRLKKLDSPERQRFIADTKTRLKRLDSPERRRFIDDTVVKLKRLVPTPVKMTEAAEAAESVKQASYTCKLANCKGCLKVSAGCVAPKAAVTEKVAVSIEAITGAVAKRYERLKGIPLGTRDGKDLAVNTVKRFNGIESKLLHKANIEEEAFDLIRRTDLTGGYKPSSLNPHVNKVRDGHIKNILRGGSYSRPDGSADLLTFVQATGKDNAGKLLIDHMATPIAKPKRWWNR
jgi:hypothetical protein